MSRSWTFCLLTGSRSLQMECHICQGVHDHLLHHFYCSPQYTSSQNQVTQLEYHYYYDSLAALLSKPWNWYYQAMYTCPIPDLLVCHSGNNTVPRHGSWPDGFTLRGELCWGKLKRVFGASQELPDFVKEDLRQMYGTYPSTSVNITYQRGEFVVRGEPRVGEQEYQVEKRLVRQIDGCHKENKAVKAKK